MEFNLIVQEGPDAGRVYHTCVEEADNILVGRDDIESKARIRLSKDDLYISRSQFLLEVRPPNVLLRDLFSANGTRLRRGEQDWIPVEEMLLQNGDLIRVGYTTLCYELIGAPDAPMLTGEELASPAEPDQGLWIETLPATPGEDEPPEHLPELALGEELQAQFPQPAPLLDQAPFVEFSRVVLDNECYCIRCNRPLAVAPQYKKTGVRSMDFMCTDCQAEVAAEQNARSARAPAFKAVCVTCGKEITGFANSDNRAADLAGLVSYQCKTCVENLQRGALQVIGDYLILEEMGRGGMGVVYRAWHRASGRLVALKQILPAVQMDETAVNRFQREMAIMQELKHSYLVRLITSGEENGAPYFVSELVNGGNLDRYISPEGLPVISPKDTTRLVADALIGMAYLHKQGFVHRDIKPENILLAHLDGQTTPKLVDFGLARSYEKHGGTVSRTGYCAGTLMYMPPEQITQFKRCQPTVDLYAMGVTLYYLLTGYYSLEFPSARDIQRRKRNFRLPKDPVRMILDDRPVPVRDRRKELPAKLCAAVDKAVCKKAVERFQTAESFRQALLETMS
jgi:serine/threonine-protein kinase